MIHCMSCGMLRFSTYCFFVGAAKWGGTLSKVALLRKNYCSCCNCSWKCVRAWRWVRYGEGPPSPDNIDFHSTWGVLVELSIAKTKGRTSQSALKNSHLSATAVFSLTSAIFFFFFPAEYNAPAPKGARHSPWPLNGLLLHFFLPLEKKDGSGWGVTTSSRGGAMVAPLEGWEWSGVGGSGEPADKKASHQTWRFSCALRYLTNDN